jgi:hypothetical protein
MFGEILTNTIGNDRKYTATLLKKFIISQKKSGAADKPKKNLIPFLLYDIVSKKVLSDLCEFTCGGYNSDRPSFNDGKTTMTLTLKSKSSFRICISINSWDTFNQTTDNTRHFLVNIIGYSDGGFIQLPKSGYKNISPKEFESIEELLYELVKISNDHK